MESRAAGSAAARLLDNPSLLAFAIGVLLFQQARVLPGALELAVAVAACGVASRVARHPWPLLLCLGVGWFTWQAEARLAGQLPQSSVGKDLVVEGRIATLPQTQGRVTRFELALDPSSDGRDNPDLRRLALAWYGGHPPLLAGDRWRLSVRLKRPRGLSNPGGFDYPAWLFARGIGATGYVRDGVVNRRLGRSPSGLLAHGRQRLAERIATVLAQSPSRGVVAALGVGVRGDITAEQWQVLRATGTSHLVAISGLHLGFVAGWVYWLTARSWRRCAWLARRYPATLGACWVTLPAVLGYAALAGFAVPTQRALVMVFAVLAARLARRSVTPGRTLLLALAGVLAVDPFVSAGAGFWLSFVAVALILLTTVGRRRSRWHWWHWGGLQVALALGLAPLLILHFHQLSLVAPLANLVAVPLVGLLVVPLVVVGTLLLLPLPWLGELLLRVAGQLVDAGWQPLAALAGGSLATAGFAASPWILALLGQLGVVWLLAPRGALPRLPGALLLLPLLLYRPPGPAAGEAWLTLLDVGQGLAAVVRTREHLLLFDTGPRFSGLRDAGNSVIEPYLASLGVTRIDLLVVSHGDSDHAGGLDSVRQRFQVGRLLAGAGVDGDPAAARCHDGQRWHWDGVEFRVLHPDPQRGGAGNDRSCVLRVAAGADVLLLTGDIEAVTEQRLIATHAASLAANLLQVPHHGSLTSSTPAFIDAIGPRLALVSSGHRNRFRLPAARVIERYRKRGVEVIDTAASGAIEVRLGTRGRSPAVTRHRDLAHSFRHRE